MDSDCQESGIFSAIIFKNLNTKFFGCFLQMGLLIFSPGTRFPRGGPGASSALRRLWGLQCPLIPQESSALRSNQPGAKST